MSEIRLAFVIGCLLGLPLVRVAVPVRAQGQPAPQESRAQTFGGAIHACAGKDDVLRMNALSATCPTGQRSVILTIASPDADESKPEDKTPPDTSLDKAVLEDLNRRLIELERLGCDALRHQKVVAPFQVVDRSGKKIFEVIENAAGLFSGAPTPVARIVANETGGLFAAKGDGAVVSFGVNDPTLAGLSVSEQGNTRVELGKGLKKGNYKLAFLSGTNQLVAGVGESPVNNAGVVLINDAQGTPKGVMEVLNDGKGRVGIMGGGGRPIVALTEGEAGGGVFYACAAGGTCEPVMVSAGTNESGVGVVATGPRFYIQGPTGAPGSFLIGKH